MEVRDRMRLRREWRRDVDHGSWNGCEILDVESSIRIAMVVVLFGKNNLTLDQVPFVSFEMLYLPLCFYLLCLHA